MFRYSLTARERRFPLRYPDGAERKRMLKGFHFPQAPHIHDATGVDPEGRERARALRRQLRGALGRRPTAKEYRAAKKAAREIAHV